MNLFLLFIICSVLVLIPGVIHRYKLYGLLSGYSTIPEEIRKKIDWQTFTLFFRNVFIINALIIISGSILFKIIGFEQWTPLLTILMVLAGSAVVVTKGQKLSRNAAGNNTNYGSTVKNMNVLLGIIGGFTLVFIVTIFLLGMQETNINLNNNNIVIKGIYSRKIVRKEIQMIELQDSLKGIILKKNGFAFGNIYKGKFQLKDKGEVMLYIVNSDNEILKIVTNKGIYYINFKDSKKTEDLFRKLSGT